MALTAMVLLASFAALDVIAMPLASDAMTAATTPAIASSTQALPSATIATSHSDAAASAPTSVASQTAVAALIPSPTSTTTVTSTVYLPASTVTVTGSPQTVTDTITIIPPPSPSSVLASTSTAQSAQPTTWSSPPQMTDLSAFNIKNFAAGRGNMRIIVSDPPLDTVRDPSSWFSGLDTIGQTLSEVVMAVASAVSYGIIPPPPKQASSSFLQLYYPANSLNPGQDPVGGADFYAAPLDLRGAQNVSLEYSVFFPSTFDWVEAGKLPGIYGGHDGCSGGDAATSCFSTRLMWRGGGVGELYLYAPKDKQTAALCATPPESVCDSDYGLSIGRGAFRFGAGKWTHVKQTVALNTPGMRDGGFALDVNGVRVIERSDVFYRDVPGALRGVSRREVYSTPASDTSTRVADSPPPIGVAGLPALPVRRAVFPTARVDEEDRSGASADTMEARDFTPSFGPPSLLLPGNASSDPPPSGPGAAISPPGVMPPPIFTSTVTSMVTVVPPAQTVIVAPTKTETAYVVAMETEASAAMVAMKAAEPVGFSGLFFSTFFGGHERKYATPKDQFTWFKDFAMTINA